MKTLENIYDETIKYFQDNNLVAWKNLDFLRFRLRYPILSLQKSLEAFASYNDKV